MYGCLMSTPRSQANEDALAILESSPSMLAKIASFVHDGYVEPDRNADGAGFSLARRERIACDK